MVRPSTLSVPSAVRILSASSTDVGKEFAGREYGMDFLTDIPENIDKCGENGEFHTFTYDGPIFSFSVDCLAGDIVLKDSRFYYCDIINKQ